MLFALTKTWLADVVFALRNTWFVDVVFFIASFRIKQQIISTLLGLIRFFPMSWVGFAFGLQRTGDKAGRLAWPNRFSAGRNGLYP